MLTFVRVLENLPSSGEKAQTDYVNEILTKLQQRGAKITSVTASMSHAFGSSLNIMYVIAYEAPAAIAI